MITRTLNGQTTTIVGDIIELYQDEEGKPGMTVQLDPEESADAARGAEAGAGTKKEDSDSSKSQPRRIDPRRDVGLIRTPAVEE